jgi:hypothetical protein
MKILLDSFAVVHSKNSVYPFEVRDLKRSVEEVMYIKELRRNPLNSPTTTRILEEYLMRIFHEACGIEFGPNTKKTFKKLE